MKVITNKVHYIYLTTKEAATVKKLTKEKLKISMGTLAEKHLGITRMSLYRKLTGQSPFFWLELAKLDKLGIFQAENHKQYIKLKNSL